jgi:pimeloyl-ACP methyl ester carboxylesterase
MRGFGFSSYKTKLTSYSDLAEDMYLFMNEAFPHIKDYLVFGHNIGGNVAMELAVKHPEKVKGIVLLALSAQNDKGNDMYKVV